MGSLPSLGQQQSTGFSQPSMMQPTTLTNNPCPSMMQPTTLSGMQSQSPMGMMQQSMQRQNSFGSQGSMGSMQRQGSFTSQGSMSPMSSPGGMGFQQGGMMQPGGYGGQQMGMMRPGGGMPQQNMAAMNNNPQMMQRQMSGGIGGPSMASGRSPFVAGGDSNILQPTRQASNGSLASGGISSPVSAVAPAQDTKPKSVFKPFC
eukprot:TRINITY_DN5518_c0_g1_i4.p3 TRINITY_DN5518_c0_g1~~TRINITY_DN5518_c0_g1_i4.p3  ORF type:complete len:203 (+),score=47.74 TRINITY_DN5518_c0_g1_i4:323-931(+)